MIRSGLVIAALLLAFVPVSAHEPSSSDVASATATAESMTLDGELDEDAWDTADDDRVKFDSPNDADSKALFVWLPDEEELWVGLVIKDGTDDAADDHVDLAFAFDHADDDADEDDQRILRAYRDGTFETISPEDESDVTAGEPDDVEAVVVDDPGEGYTVEVQIAWEESLAGWAVWQIDDTDDSMWPDDAEREDPGTWADVAGIKSELEVSLKIDKLTAKLDDTLTLTATVDDFDDLVDFDEKVLFERYDGSTWTTLTSKAPDDDGDAKTTSKVTLAGAVKYRARIAESDLYAEAISPEVTVTVADASTKLHGDSVLFIRYAADVDGWRTYTIVANTTSSFPTVEASPDGTSWTRLAAGVKGSPLTTTWSPPDEGTWHMRGVSYDAAGKAATPVEVDAPAYTLPGTRTGTTLTLDGDTDDEAITLVAELAPAASGTVTFYRAPNTVLGTVAVAAGKATLEVAKPLPGEQTYVARYGGSTTHKPSTDRAEVETWPEDPAMYSPRPTDASGEKIAIAQNGASVVFTARAGDGPGLAGAVEILATPEGSDDPEILFRGMTTTGSVTAPFKPKETGDYDLAARFYRASGTGVVADTRTASASGADEPVELDLDVPRTAEQNATIEVLVTLDPAPVGGNVTLLVDGRPVDEAPATKNMTFEWVATPSGKHELRARYSGAPGFTAAESDAVSVTVKADPVDGGDVDGNTTVPPTDEDKGMPAAGWLAVLFVVALAARARRT